MKTQCIDEAITTEAMAINLGFVAEEPKSSLRELLACCGQVGTALSLCWMLHLIA